MFQKNLNAIKVINPKLAERLEKIDITSITGIEVFEAENKDLIISYKNAPLHSAIDPTREAKTTWNRTIKNELKRNDVQIVFGLGLGYLFKRAYVSAESKIFIIEPFIEVLRFVLEHVDFSAELSDPRVYITDNVGDIYEKLQKEYLSGDRLEFLFTNQYALANQNLLQDLTSKIIEIVEGRGSDEATIFKFNDGWVKNFLKNTLEFPETRPLGFLEGKFADTTALIVAAGPSLADDLQKIKDNQDKFTIIAVGKAFKTLVKADVIPDFTVFVDAWGCLDQIQGVEDSLEKTNLILLSKADNELYKLKSKSKILYLSEVDSMTKIFKNKIPENIGFYKSGGSVSIIAYYIAKALGFGQIIFSGLDLAFIDNKMFADGQTAEEIKSDLKLMHVKDRDGKEILTRADYAWFIRQFNEIFTEEINLAGIINTSLKGAAVEGMEYMAFSEAVKTLSSAKPNIDEIISAVYAESKDNWNLVLNSIYPKFKQEKEDLEKINEVSTQLHEDFNKICNQIKALGKSNYYLPDVFQTLSNKSTEIRHKIVDNLFLSITMQRHIWVYTKNYVTKTITDKEDVIKNLELDTEFYRVAKNYSSTLIGHLNNAIKAIEEKQSLVTK